MHFVYFIVLRNKWDEFVEIYCRADHKRIYRCHTSRKYLKRKKEQMRWIGEIYYRGDPSVTQVENIFLKKK